MSKLTEEIKLRVSPELKSQLESIAEKEQRTLSQMVRIALAEWVKGQEINKYLVTTEDADKAWHFAKALTRKED